MLRRKTWPIQSLRYPNSRNRQWRLLTRFTFNGMRLSSDSEPSSEKYTHTLLSTQRVTIYISITVPRQSTRHWHQQWYFKGEFILPFNLEWCLREPFHHQLSLNQIYTDIADSPITSRRFSQHRWGAIKVCNLSSSAKESYSISIFVNVTNSASVVNTERIVSEVSSSNFETPASLYNAFMAKFWRDFWTSAYQQTVLNLPVESPCNHLLILV